MADLMPDTSIYQTKQPSLTDLLKSISSLKDLKDMVAKTPGAAAADGSSATAAASDGPPPGTPSAARSAASAAAPSEYDPLYSAADQKYGLPSGTMKGMGWIESRNDPRAWTRGSSYKGLMQIGPDEARTHGVNVWDPASSIEGAAQIAAGNQYAFRQSLGRDPSAHEVYLMHQQGRAGGIALISNPGLPAYQALMKAGVPKAQAIRHITANGGDPDAPAGKFVAKWAGYYPRGASATGARSANVPGTIEDAAAGAGYSYGQ